MKKIFDKKEHTPEKTESAKKVKLTREERAEIRMQKKEAREQKRTIKRAVKGQDRLKLAKDKATIIEPDKTPYDGYYEDLVPFDTKRHSKPKIEWKNVITAILLIIAAMIVVALCVNVLVGGN